MMFSRLLFLLPIFLAPAFLTGCANVPVKEVADARAAVKAAQEACVEHYLKQEYEVISNLAQEAETQFEEASKSIFKGYKKARVAAIKSKTKADSGVLKAADLRLRAKNDAERAIREAIDAIALAEKGEARTYAPAKLESAQSFLVEAKNIFFVSGCGYSSVIEKAKLAQISADEAMKQVKAEKEQLAKQEAEHRARMEVEKLAMQRASVETAPDREVLHQKAAHEKGTASSAQSKDPMVKVPALAPVTEYIVDKNETLWQISARKEIYGDPYLWPLIYKANRSQIKDPTQIFEGQRLVIPRGVIAKDMDEAIAEAREKGLWQGALEEKERNGK